MKVWKYELRLTEVQTIPMPKGSTVLTAGSQRGQLCIWVLVTDETAEQVHRTIVTVGTGHEIPKGYPVKHVGTVLLAGGNLVVHVFETPE